MALSLVVLWLLLWAGLGASVPTRRGRHGRAGRGAHGRSHAPAPVLLDQQGGDYRVDDSAYIDDYPDDLRDYDYQVTPERKRGDSEGDDYPDDGDEGGGDSPDRSTAKLPHAHPPPPNPADIRKPRRYQNGTLYDDYVAQCSDLISDARRVRAQPDYPLFAALVVALAATHVL